jgi:dTDP-4-amino-4,6-dideoxygalactose transaminase
MEYRVPFNRPVMVGRELQYITEAVNRGNLAGDGHFTTSCSRLLEQRFGALKVLMTPSGTASLELACMLAELGGGDEVLLPSFTFVSTANAVVRTGARPVFVDIRRDTMNLDEELLEPAITPRTRAIIPVHYAGNACQMDRILAIARKHDLVVIEDAAQAVNSFYRGKALGTLGDLGAYSFHETKNYMCGEGGALCINTPRYLERAHVLRDKGTNRQRFLRGEVDKYTWVAVGSSFLPNELSCAFLYAQLEMLDAISRRREELYESYRRELSYLESEDRVRLPVVQDGCIGNHHIFFLLLADSDERDRLIDHLRRHGIQSVFHYVPLHDSPMGKSLGYRRGDLPVTEEYSGRLLRLPLYYAMTVEEQAAVIGEIKRFFRSRRAAAKPMTVAQTSQAGVS